MLPPEQVLVAARIAALEAKSYDTRLMWGQALKGLLDTRQEMREHFDKLSKKMLLTNRRFEVFTSEFLELRARQSDREDRMDKLKPAPDARPSFSLEQSFSRRYYGSRSQAGCLADLLMPAARYLK